MRRRRATIAALGVMAPAAIAGCLAWAQAQPAPLLVENVTPSMPLGLYRRVERPIQVGAVIALRQPAAARAYLKTLGFPPEALLLKRVAAADPQTVCAGDKAVWTSGGLRLPTRQTDRLGARLPHWSGCQRLASSEVIVVGDDPRSFDSRYFGPVSTHAIVGVYQRLQ